MRNAAIQAQVPAEPYVLHYVERRVATTDGNARSQLPQEVHEFLRVRTKGGSGEGLLPGGC